jgi:hypothetical protein
MIISNKVKKLFNVMLLIFFGYTTIMMIPTLLTLGINLFVVERRFFIATFLGNFVGLIPFCIIIFLVTKKCLKSYKLLSTQTSIRRA